MRQDVEVAILLATYNGSRFVAEQIRSLAYNTHKFTLHWMDDQSTDDTEEVVRKTALSSNITLKEWHQAGREGVPGAYIRLLDCVDADIYLFCDQDDVWQPGKIDATVTNLLPDLQAPALCFSDPLIFRSEEPHELHRLSEVLGVTGEQCLLESRVFMAGLPRGHTEGFTKPLRDLYVSHSAIARSHAIMHDVWMYGLAVSLGMARLLPNAPTTLYRWHSYNVSGGYGYWKGTGAGRVTLTWEQQQRLRRGVARNARGFVLAARSLRHSAKLDRILAIARLVGKLDQRQSLADIVRLVRRRALWKNRRHRMWLATVCLLSEATE